MVEKPIISVVETIPHQSLKEYSSKIYDPEFWKPLIPLRTPVFDKSSERSFYFEIDDNIRLNPTGTLNQSFQAQGTIDVVDHGEQDSKGQLWDITIEVISPIASVKARVRARDIVDSDSVNAMKIGIYIQAIEYDRSLLKGVGPEAVLFAIRIYLREAIKKAGNLH
ncbi:MAG: hypothetical protein ACTSYI_13105 [Promethearchaeota archaeon]